MLKTIRKGFFSTDSRKGRSYISSKYIVTGEKRRRREFFTTGCGSCRKKRSIDSFEASCGACAPRSVRKRGQSVGVPKLTHTASSPFPGSPQEGPTAFSPQLAQRVLQKTRLHRSELAYLIHGVLETHFNNHYFTLPRNPIFGSGAYII